MGPKRIWSQNFSLNLVKFKKLWFSAPLSQPQMLLEIPKSTITHLIVTDTIKRPMFWIWDIFYFKT